MSKHLREELETARLAVYALHLPPTVQALRSKPLPKHVSVLLQIAAGEEDVTNSVADALERPTQVIRDAAAHFIEMILLAPGTDYYRVLGANPETSDAEIRRNVTLLLKWLHPDAGRAGYRTVYAKRVVDAWNNLKTAERRAGFDATRRTTHNLKALANGKAKKRKNSYSPHLRAPENESTTFNRVVDLMRRLFSPRSRSGL